MAQKYSKQEFWDIYENLPEELQETIFSEKTAEYINTVCEKQEIEPEKISEVARFTGRVLMGLLKPEEFKQLMQEDLDLSKEKAENVFRGISRLVFMPHRQTLEALHGIEISSLPKPETPSGETEEKISPKREAPDKKPGKDRYREPIPGEES